MKILLRVLAGVVVLVVAVVVAGVAIVMSMDPNEHRDRLTAEVKKATGRDLVINGDLSVGISLIPTIVANDVTFSNAPWGSRPEMASIERLEAALEILPLLSGDVRISRIELVQPDILLEVAPDGRANWDFASATDEKASSATDAGEESPPAIPAIESLSIDDGVFRYNDMRAKQDLTVALDRVRISDAAADKLDIEAAGTYNGTPFEIEGTVDSIDRIAADAQDYALDLEASAVAATAEVKGTIAKPMTAPRLTLDFSLSGKDLTETLDAARALVPALAEVEVPAIGSYDISGRAVGDATAPAIENLKFALGSTDALKLTGTGRGAKNTYTIDKFMAEIYGSDLSGSLTASLGGTVPQIKGNLTSHMLDLADIERLLAPGGEAPASDSSQPAPETAAKKDDGRVFPADPLPLDGLKAVNAAVTLKGDRVVAKGTTVDAIDATANLANGKLTLEPFAATISDGRISGRVVVDASAATPAVETDIALDKMDVGKLLKEREITDLLTGKVSAKIDARGTGNSVRALMASLTGETEVIMDEGEIASRYVDMLAADLAKQLIPGGGSNVAHINCFVSRFDVKQGIATSTALLFDTDKMTVGGGGTIDLRTESLQLVLEPQPKDASLVSLAVPLRVSGTLSDPSVAPTTASVLKRVAGLAITGFTPVGILAALASAGSGEDNPCLAALERAPANQNQEGQTQPPANQPSGNPLEDIKKGVGDTLRGILGR